MTDPTVQSAMEEADWVAVGTLIIVAHKTVNKEKVTKSDMESVSKALAWMAVRNPKVFDELLEAADQTMTPEFQKMSSGTSSMAAAMQMSPMMATAAAAGGKRRRKLRGGANAVQIVLSLIAIIFGGSNVQQVYRLASERDAVRTMGLEHIRDACPIDLSLPPPAAPLIDWGGDHARALAEFKSKEATCNAVRGIVQQRVAAADAALAAVWTRIPAQAGALATAGTLAAGGVVTPATLAAAGTMGATITQVTQSFVNAQLPSGNDLNSFASTLAKAFPNPPAAEQVALPAPAAAGAPAPRGRAAAAEPLAIAPPQGGRRKSRRSRKTKRRVTRRRAPMLVKFAY